ncbi:SciC protein [Burkholderia multivorans]|nr:SciC protein [Burkholderia multivorans]
MRIRPSVVLLSIASFVPMTGYTQHAPSPADQAAAARANAEQDRQAQQQREAQQREAVNSNLEVTHLGRCAAHLI